MKKTIKKAISIVLVAVMVFGVAPLAGFVGLDLPDLGTIFAAKAEAATYEGTCGENLTWTLDTETGALVISGTGSMEEWSSSTSAPWYSYRSYIRSIIIDNGVTSIGRYSFVYNTNNSNYNKLTSVTIPDSITSIGKMAFDGCFNVVSVYYTGDLAGWCSINFNFSSSSNPMINAEKLYINGVLLAGDVVIPDGVTTIPHAAFSNCRGLTSVIIPDSVTSIGDSAFKYCGGLTSITIPDSVTSIGYYAFSYCTSLTNITIPDSVTSIGECAFSDCTSLTCITVGSANTAYSSDEYGAFFNKNKTELIQYPIGNARTSYEIPDSVTSIGYCAFRYCASLTSITIPDSVTSIGYYAFSYCTSLTSITIPDSVTSIGAGAFEYCSSLTSITIPNSVTSIDNKAFARCSSLTSITIPDSVTIINNAIFSGCGNLTSVTIGNSVTSIIHDAFYGCYSLTDVYYNGSEEEWNLITIGSNNDCLTNATIHYTTMRFAQTHVISDYISRNDDYTQKYFEGNGQPLDGSNGTVDMCIPGLNSEDDMIPQGITYYPQKNWLLISAYSSSKSAVKDRPSMIYALDFATGKYVAEYKIFNSDGTPHTGHVGGIAASANNLYITTEDGTISYIPLSAIELPERVSSKDIQIVDSFKVAYASTEAGTSYLSYSDGCLWTGNFYYHLEEKYKKPASEEFNSVVLGYKASGRDSADEWKAVSKSSPAYNFGIPNYYNAISKLEKIQGVAVSLKNKKMTLITSYGRKNNSEIFFVDISDNEINGSDIIKTEGLPMLEGAFILNDYVYTATESASYYYNGYDPSDKSKDPTDVVWRFPYRSSVVRDEETDISVYYHASDESEYEVVTEEHSDEDVFGVIHSNIYASKQKVFDIKLLVDGGEYQSKIPVTVKIPLPDGYSPLLTRVVYVNAQTRTVEEIPTTYLDGYLIFETNHFSYYAIVECYDFTLSIRTPSATTINYGDSIVLHYEITGTLPDGAYVEWSASNGNFNCSVSEDKKTCTITPDKKGDTTFTVIVYDAEGNIVSTDEQTMTSKAGFFDKIIAFFKKIFGLTKTIPEAVKVIY
ncbi:MAG: leucine-rich repeat domain-containing protein [Clostridia bacterium]|nr:leucine-rich repeat domain-containing protein [Clostridia bacterium]